MNRSKAVMFGVRAGSEIYVSHLFAVLTCVFCGSSLSSWPWPWPLTTWGHILWTTNHSRFWKWLLLHQPQSNRSRVTLYQNQRWLLLGTTISTSMSPARLSCPQFDWLPSHAAAQPSRFAAWPPPQPLSASSPARLWAGLWWCYVGGQGQRLIWQALCLVAPAGPHQCLQWGWCRAALALWTAARRWGSWGHRSASWAGSVSGGQTWKIKVSVKRLVSVTAHFVVHIKIKIYPLILPVFEVIGKIQTDSSHASKATIIFYLRVQGVQFGIIYDIKQFFDIILVKKKKKTIKYLRIHK